MGIVYNYIAVTPKLLKDAQADQALAKALIYHDYGSPEPSGVLQRIDLDKAWDGVTYLISGERRATNDLYLPVDPLAQAVVGREERLGEGWFEEGREPLILEPDTVRRLALALAPLTQEDLRLHYDEDGMRAAEVYSVGASLDYYLNAFDVLKTFYDAAARDGAAVVIHTS